MIKMIPHKLVILMGLLLSPSAFAEDINVDFTATVKATTCNITLTALNGSSVTNDGNDNYTLRMPNMGLDKIVNAATEAQADFKLVASGCSSGISWIDTTLSGNQSGTSPKLIIPLASDSSSTTDYIGMGIKRQSADIFNISETKQRRKNSLEFNRNQYQWSCNDRCATRDIGRTRRSRKLSRKSDIQFHL